MVSPLSGEAEQAKRPALFRLFIQGIHVDAPARDDPDEKARADEIARQRPENAEARRPFGHRASTRYVLTTHNLSSRSVSAGLTDEPAVDGMHDRPPRPASLPTASRRPAPVASAPLPAPSLICGRP